MKKFLIAEAEKARILGMHYKAMGKSLVNEQDNIPWDMEIANRTGIRGIGGMETEYMETGQFEVTFTTQAGGSKTFAYQCITDPRKKEGEGGFKGGTLRDYYGNTIVDPKTAGLKGDWLNYIKQYCKPANTWLANYNAKNAPQPQVAAATTAKVTAPNPISEPQKRSEASKANAEQLRAQMIPKLSDTNFLNPNKEKSELDKDVNDTLTLIAVSPPSGDEALMLKRKINSLIKVKPEYKSDPYYLSINF
jgi:hypothetical protein